MRNHTFYSNAYIQVAEVSDEVDVASLVDLNAILRSKKVSKSLSKKRSKKKVKATLSSVEVAMHAEEDDKMGDEDPCVKCDLSAEGQCGSDMTLDILLSFQQSLMFLMMMSHLRIILLVMPNSKH